MGEEWGRPEWWARLGRQEAATTTLLLPSFPPIPDPPPAALTGLRPFHTACAFTGRCVCRCLRGTPLHLRSAEAQEAWARQSWYVWRAHRDPAYVQGGLRPVELPPRRRSSSRSSAGASSSQALLPATKQPPVQEPCTGATAAAPDPWSRAEPCAAPAWTLPHAGTEVEAPVHPSSESEGTTGIAAAQLDAEGAGPPRAAATAQPARAKAEAQAPWSLPSSEGSPTASEGQAAAPAPVASAAGAAGAPALVQAGEHEGQAVPMGLMVDQAAAAPVVTAPSKGGGPPPAATAAPAASTSSQETVSLAQGGQGWGRAGASPRAAAVAGAKRRREAAEGLGGGREAAERPSSELQLSGVPRGAVEAAGGLSFGGGSGDDFGFDDDDEDEDEDEEQEQGNEGPDMSRFPRGYRLRGPSTHAPERSRILKPGDVQASMVGRMVALLWRRDGLWWPACVVAFREGKEDRTGRPGRPKRKVRVSLYYETGEQEEGIDLLTMARNGEVAWLLARDVHLCARARSSRGQAKQPPPKKAKMARPTSAQLDRAAPACAARAAARVPATAAAAAVVPGMGSQPAQQPRGAPSRALKQPAQATAAAGVRAGRAGTAGLGQPDGAAAGAQWPAAPETPAAGPAVGLPQPLPPGALGAPLMLTPLFALPATALQWMDPAAAASLNSPAWVATMLSSAPGVAGLPVGQAVMGALQQPLAVPAAAPPVAALATGPPPHALQPAALGQQQQREDAEAPGQQTSSASGGSSQLLQQLAHQDWREAHAQQQQWEQQGREQHAAAMHQMRELLALGPSALGRIVMVHIDGKASRGRAATWVLEDGRTGTRSPVPIRGEETGVVVAADAARGAARVRLRRTEREVELAAAEEGARYGVRLLGQWG
eukprot:scaffold8.g1450.t1